MYVCLSNVPSSFIAAHEQSIIITTLQDCSLRLCLDTFIRELFTEKGKELGLRGNQRDTLY